MILCFPQNESFKFASIGPRSDQLKVVNTFGTLISVT